MLRMRTKTDALTPQTNGGPVGSGGENVWEVRPGGMLVQKRTDGDQNRVPPPTIRVRVKYGSVYHEVHVSSQASFGELKKLLSGPTGLHHLDQKLFYRDKERDSVAFLDVVGVKDKSKLVLQEDPISQEKRYLEMKKNAKMEKAAKLISDISLEVDRLAGQVSALETVILRGGKVPEKDVASRIDSLMNQLVKLDGITADGDVKLQRKMQVIRVQKYIETLDKLKIKGTTPVSDGDHVSLEQPTTPQQVQQRSLNRHESSPAQPHQETKGSISSPVEQQQAIHSLDRSPSRHQPSRHTASGAAVVITTRWETFDSAPPPVLGTPSSTSTPTTQAARPSFTWDLL